MNNRLNLAIINYKWQHPSTMIADATDLTPPNWCLPQSTPKESLKRLLRRICIPPYLRLIHPLLAHRYARFLPFPVDQWYWGGRGMAMDILHRKVSRCASGVSGKTILIIGCGTGRDIPSWLSLKPKRVIGIDCFNYATAWRTLQSQSDIPVHFIQANLEQLNAALEAPVDLIVSDAVFEHIRHMDRVLPALYQALVPGGVMYANFGPLYYSWGGDHISGYDHLKNGFQHLVLDPPAYQQYLDEAGDFEHSEHDGRTWIQNDLFSYFKPSEYIQALTQAGFKKIHHGAVIEPRAVRCLKKYPALKAQLLNTHQAMDLVTGGLMIVYEK